MKISTRGRYGLRAMIDIAANEQKCVNLKSISERQGVSEHYLEQLMPPLRKAGFIKSVRGAQGGYVLIMPPQDISVGDILRVLEGSLTPVACVDDDSKEGYSCGNANCNNCVTKPVWEKIYSGLNEVIDSITLKELAEDFKKVSS